MQKCRRSERRLGGGAKKAKEEEAKEKEERAMSGGRCELGRMELRRTRQGW